MGKKLFIIGAVIVVVAVGIWWWRFRTPSTEMPAAPGAPAAAAPESDTISEISHELEGVDIDMGAADINIDNEFRSIDAELNNL